MVQNTAHVFLGLADTQAAYGIAVKTYLLQTRQRFITQSLIHAPLYDGKQGVGVLQPLKLVLGTTRPA